MGQFSHRLINFWPWACAALSGFLLALCFPGWNQGWLVWIALTPLIAAVWFSPRTGKRLWLRDAGLGYLAGYVFFGTVFIWLGQPLAGLFQNPWLGTLPWLLALYLGLFFAGWTWFIGLLPREDTTFLTSGRNVRIAFLAASVWVALEWVRGWLFGGFGWDGLGIALHQNLALIQVADITGVLGLTFLVAFSNVIALITVRRFVAEVGKLRIRPHWDFSLMMAAVVGSFAYGVHALQHPVTDTVPLRLAAIQPAIKESDKWSRETAEKIYDRYAELSDLAFAHSPNLQLLIWPEAATLEDLYKPDDLEFLRDVIGDHNAAFLLGSFESPIGGGDYNIAACLTHRAKDVQVYRKMHLVPFGEYIPARHSFPLFAKIAGELVPGDMLPGKDYTVFKIDDPPLRIAPLICFEDTLGDQTRRFVQQDAQLMINITNDSWFGESAGAAQHLANAKFRAVENRRPLVRCANTGVTCVIDSLGRVVDQLSDANGSPSFQAGMLSVTVDVPRHGPVTFYTQHGDWVAWLAVACSLIGLIRPICRLGPIPPK